MGAALSASPPLSEAELMRLRVLLEKLRKRNRAASIPDDHASSDRAAGIPDDRASSDRASSDIESSSRLRLAGLRDGCGSPLPLPLPLPLADDDDGTGDLPRPPPPAAGARLAGSPAPAPPYCGRRGGGGGTDASKLRSEGLEVGVEVGECSGALALPMSAPPPLWSDSQSPL